MSKGSSPRPFSVKLNKFDSNWDAIFNKDKTVRVDQDPAEVGACGCGRSPSGKCIGWHSLTEIEYRDALTRYNQTHGKDK